GAVVELEHHVGLALEPGPVNIGEKLEQDTIAHLARHPAAVALHEAVPHLHLVLLVEYHQPHVQVLDYVHQPMKFTNFHGHSLEHVHDFVVHGGDGIFGKQQQQVTLHCVILDPVVDLYGQGTTPETLVG